MLFLRNIMISMLLVSIVGSTLMVPLIYVDFEIRRDYISKVLCVERDNPITICKGRCYLSSSLEKAVEHEQEKKETQPLNEIVFFFPQYTRQTLSNFPFNQQDSFIVSDQFLNDQDNSKGLFRPPRG